MKLGPEGINNLSAHKAQYYERCVKYRHLKAVYKKMINTSLQNTSTPVTKLYMFTQYLAISGLQDGSHLS